MNVRHAYNEWAQTYDTDRNLTRDLDEKVMRETFAQKRFRTVIELGCGTGKNTAMLATIAESVCALDFSESMLVEARKRVPAGNVTFTTADITHPWPVRDGKADLIAGNLVLEHIEQLGPVFAEASRALIPGGRLFLCELHPFRQYEGGKARFVNQDGVHEIIAYTHHVSDFTTAATANGFRVESVREWWHDEDGGKPPRLISFMFVR